MAKLRDLYDRHRIKLHVLTISPSYTPKQVEKIRKEKLERLPRLLEAIRRKYVVLFLDECVFTNRSI